RLWETRTDAERLAFDVREPVHAVAFSADGERLATGSTGNVRGWDTRTGRELFALEHSRPPVRAPALRPRGAPPAAGYADGMARVCDARTGRLLLGVRHTGVVFDVAFSPDGTRLATAAGEAARLWDAHTGRELLTLPGHKDGVSCVAFSPDGTRL